MAIRDKLKQEREKEKKILEVDDEDKREVLCTKALEQKKLPFERVRMWVHYVLSSLQKDRGRIPKNIGNRMLITNNMYVTRYYMSSIIQIEALGLSTPILFQQELLKFLRRSGSAAVVDFSMKNMKFDVDLKDSGLRARIRSWSIIAGRDNVSDKEKEIAARGLYTVDVAQTGVPLYKTRMYVTLRARTGSELMQAEMFTSEFLASLASGRIGGLNAEHKQVIGNLREVLEYNSIIGSRKPSNIKDIKAVILSEQTMAEMMPNSGCFNSTRGVYLANNVRNGSQFLLDFTEITAARNLYLQAASGRGKTVLALNICCSAFEEGYAVCIQDIKGNEFTNFVEAAGGYVLSLRENSAGYINSWQMHKEDTSDADAEAYFRQRLSFSKQQIIILSGLVNPEDRADLEELLDAFHDALYMNLGVMAGNRNTWGETRVLNPFTVYENLMEYMTPSIIAKYPGVSRKVVNSLRMYMSRDGSKSYLFTQEFDYASVLRSMVLSFDFGLLESSSELKDPVVFKLKFAYMRKLNAEFAAYKFKKGIKVFKVLEESQVVVNDEDVIKGYVEEFTLRRAQGQTTLLLGNSVSALLDSPLGRPIIENVTGLLIGSLEEGAKEVTIQRFALEEYASIIEQLTVDDRYENAFVFINRMQKKAAIPILKVLMDREAKLFKARVQSNSGVG